MQGLFPLMIVSFALNQVRPLSLIMPAMPAVLAAGQLTAIITLLLAFTILFLALPGSVWPAFVLGALLILRGVRLAVIEPGLFDVAYTVVLGIVTSGAGALIVARRPGLLQRQFAWFCLLSLPLMLLQMIGVQWTQLLRSDVGPLYLGYTQVPTLFVRAGDVVITTLQSRPAGFLYSNNAASLIIAFGLAWHYGRLDSPGRLRWTDLAVLTATVLAMSRVVYVILLLLWIFSAARGPDFRRHVLSSVGVIVVVLGLYRLFFPGLFAANTSWYALYVDVEVRVADLLVSTGIPILVRLASSLPREAFGRHVDVMKVVVEGQTGYGSMFRNWRAIVPATVLALPFVWAGLRAVKTFDRPLRLEVAYVAMAAILLPLITSFLAVPMFWFLAGAGLLPLWQTADRSFYPGRP